MYTGIVETIGWLSAIYNHSGGGRRIEITTGEWDLSDVKLGDSIAVNGVCLTVVAIKEKGFVADVSVETLSLTTLGRLQEGARVNLEKSLKLSDRLGGHLVQGHVDGVGKVIEMAQKANGHFIKVQFPAKIGRFIAKKGSICVDGISLTVNEVDNTRFELMIIPHTWEKTTMHLLKVGDHINLEVDLLARYLARLQGVEVNESALNEARLKQLGY